MKNLSKSIYWVALCSLPRDRGTYIVIGLALCVAKYLEFSPLMWLVAIVVGLILSYILCVSVVKEDLEIEPPSILEEGGEN
jgi:membrane glycosyltransferase